jgi:PAS domain S-box-containing protein
VGFFNSSYLKQKIVCMEEKQVKHNELTFQLIVESSPNAIVLVNKEGKIAYVNNEMEKLFGYTKTELIGQMVEILIPQRYRERHPDFRGNFFSSPSVRAMGAGRELFAIRKNKSELPIEIGLKPIVTVDGTMVLASIIDITERKKAEERFRLVVESSPSAMILVNQDGNITLINKQTEILFGYKRIELIGKKLEVLIPERFAHDHVGYRSRFFEKPLTRAMGVGRDLFARRKDGSEIQVEIGLNPIETEDGQLVLASIIDITERKMQEVSLKKQIELETKNKELEQFAFLASHDLQEPLRTISNYMQIFEEDYLVQLDDNAKKYIQSVKNASKRMSVLVKALLDFSRLGRDRKLAYVDCKKLLDNVISDLQDMIKKSGATIEVSEMPSLNIYEVEVSQLFQNLITNAIKFQDTGATPRVLISSKKVNDKWQFSVGDNGIGIASIHFGRIFDIFQRLHTNASYEGNGIGLANCKKIVELHQGEIWVESTQGKGTTFNFTIPQLHI